MRLIIIGGIAAIALCHAALAQTFEGSDGIELREVFGTVTINLENEGPLVVDLDGPEADALRLREGRAVSILGEFDHRDFQTDLRRAMRKYPNGSNRSERAFLDMLKERPSLTITAAPGTAIRVVDGAVKLKVRGDAGAVEIEGNSMLLGQMDNIETGSVEVIGTGSFRLGNIAGAFDGNVHGSGDLVFDNAGSAQIAVHGSGDLEGGSIAGDLKASVHGSGDLELGDVGGRVGASVHGSGDLTLGKIGGGLDASVHGSGDLTAQSVTKSLKVDAHGSGELDIDGGAVSDLDVQTSGSGELRYAGTAINADLSTGGAGSIDVGAVSGQLLASGKNIRVDGKKVQSNDN
ncbi:MAG: DUF2807 domain-containing protein [Pseudomonadota bacterium]